MTTRVTGQVTKGRGVENRVFVDETIQPPPESGEYVSVEKTYDLGLPYKVKVLDLFNGAAISTHSYKKMIVSQDEKQIPSQQYLKVEGPGHKLKVANKAKPDVYYLEATWEPRPSTKER
ncbi:hypothetical protein A2773_05255 [Candidatus Gottesmanbacteria bacterium RIFCSPHIGHO2_01_FULL_39_10]|uniref:Uncharacterized protein n=1 Tax=Candidatus Gottesmanbacteria bacterium RIFCSPHIGHO2_01_FULL_39_10 TaxID=1798375 RepID=A0A1F5ZNW2_9BACT|nr:MAG: hypothetical protein A2773_05255 [Candidatus Gottesmanbacteria bacterium RIFCSPHIGHO2_01_FULL_39_10]